MGPITSTTSPSNFVNPFVNWTAPPITPTTLNLGASSHQGWPSHPTSCGAPETQSICGNFIANYVLHTPGGGQIAIPGLFCVECSNGGGGSDGGGSGDGSGDANSGGGYSGGGIPASDEVYPTEPISSQVDVVTELTAAFQNAELGGKGSGHPTAGGLVVEGTLDGKPFTYFETPFIGRGSGPTHAEALAMSAALATIAEEVNPGAKGRLLVNIITEHEPCGYYCGPRIRNGTWQAALQTAANEASGTEGNLEVLLKVLWHEDDGTLRPYNGR